MPSNPPENAKPTENASSAANDDELKPGESLNAKPTPEPDVKADDAAKPGDAAPAPDVAPVKKRKRVGDGPARELRVIRSEAPPPDETKRDRAWRNKYDGGIGGRERACIVLAKSVHATSYKVSRYIKDNGGTPFIDPDNQQEGLDWYNTLVCAWDEILPAHVNAAPHLVASIGIGTLTVQAAMTAYKVSKAKKLGEGAAKSAQSATDAIREEAVKVDVIVKKEETEKKKTDAKDVSELARMRAGK